MNSYQKKKNTIANKYLKKWSNLSLGKMNTMKFSIAPIRMAIIFLKASKAGKENPLSTLVGAVTMKAVWRFFKRVKPVLIHDVALPPTAGRKLSIPETLSGHVYCYTSCNSKNMELTRYQSTDE